MEALVCSKSGGRPVRSHPASSPGPRLQLWPGCKRSPLAGFDVVPLPAGGRAACSTAGSAPPWRAGP